MSRRSSIPDPSSSAKRIKTHHDGDEAFALHVAAKAGDEGAVREILEGNKTDEAFAVDAKDQGGFTAFAYACHGRHVGVMRLLLEAGADVRQEFDVPDGATTCAALTALLPPDTTMMETLLELGLSANETFAFTTPADLSLLVSAVDFLSNEMVTLLLAHGADVDAIGGSGKSALLAAIEIQLPDLVETLLAAGADPDLRGQDGDTPLRLAASLGNLDIAAMLVEAGAYVDLAGLDEMVRVLLQLGASPNPEDEGRLLPLHAACIGLDHRIAEMLLDAGADVNAACDGDMTPLIFAIQIGADPDDDFDHDALLRTIRLLAERGADLNFRDHLGRAALHFGLECPLEAFKLLLELGADPNVRDVWDNTPLHEVAWEEATIEYADALVAAGADAHAANAEGETPFLGAVENDDEEMMQLLLENVSDEMPLY